MLMQMYSNLFPTNQCGVGFMTRARAHTDTLAHEPMHFIFQARHGATSHKT